VGGCPESVEDHVSSFIMLAGDSKALSNRMAMLGMDNELRLKAGNAARINVEKMFSVLQNVKQTEQVYRDVLGGNFYDIP